MIWKSPFHLLRGLIFTMMKYEDIGPCKQYRELSNKYFKELEKELGNENPADLYQGTCVFDPDNDK